MTGFLASLLPAQASQHAAQLDTITTLVHLLMIVLFLGWGTFFVSTLIRFRAGRNPNASYAGATAKATTWTEVAVVGAELLLLIGFALPAWATRTRDLPPASAATVVRIVAEQFAWNVHYPGRDGQFGRTDPALIDPGNPLGLDRRSPYGADDVVKVNQLALPVDRPDDRAAVSERHDPQLRSAGHARQAGRDTGHDDSRLVYPHRARGLRYRVLSALWTRALPDARRGQGDDQRRV